jgi:transposase
MDERVDLRDQAADLRRQGYSYSQIGRRLNVHKSVIARWVNTVPFDGFNDESRAEQLGAVRNPQLYNRALELRQAGWSYKMIEAEIGVARSTLSGWLRNVTFAQYDPRVPQRVLHAQTQATQRNIQRREVAEQQIRDETTAEMGKLLEDGLSDRELFFVGLMLYWAEGGKTQNHISLSNSDPLIIQLYVLWLRRCLNVQRSQLRANVHAYPDIDVEHVEAYWAEVIGIDRSQFYKIQIDNRTDKTFEKYGKLPHGTVHVKVLGHGAANLHRRIMGWIAGLGKYVGATTRE